ncbi:hypothetical protein KA183_00675 [bacterium]|nr:hypothetical protein [bacterium]
MHSMLRQHQIRAQDIKPYVRTYDRKNPVGADEWATQEGMLYGPGMLIFVLEPAKRPPGLTSFAKPQADAAPDLFRVKDLSCVVDKIENKSWVLNITPSAYELRFLDTLFREKAKKAIFDGLDLNYLIAKPRQELSENQLKELRQIANSYSDGGSRRSLVQEGAELEEPTRAILNFLGVDWSSQPNKQVIEIGTICHMLFAPDPGQEDPLRQSIRNYFTAVMSSESLASEGIVQPAQSVPAPIPVPTQAPAKATYSFTQPEDYIEPDSEPDFSQFQAPSESESDFDMSDLDLEMDLDADMAPLEDTFPMATQEFGRPAIGGDSEDMEVEGEIPSLPSWYLTTHDVQEMNSHARSLFALARSTSAKSQNGDTPASGPKEDFSAQFINDYEQGLAGAEEGAVEVEAVNQIDLLATEEPGPEYSETIFGDTGARGSLETNPEASTAKQVPVEEIIEPESTPSQEWEPLAGEDLPELHGESDFDAMQEEPMPPAQEKVETASLLSRLTGAVGQEAPLEVAEPVKDPLKPPTNLKEMLTADSEVFRVSKPASSPAASAQEIFAQSSDSNANLNQVPVEQTAAPKIEPNFNIEIETPPELTSMEMSVPDFSSIANEYALDTTEPEQTQEPEPATEQSAGFFETPINAYLDQSPEVFQDEWSSSDTTLESEAEPIEFAPARDVEEIESEETDGIEDVYEDSPAVPWEVAPPEEETVDEESMLMPPPGLFQPDEISSRPITTEIVAPEPQAIITPPPLKEPETTEAAPTPAPVTAEIEAEPELEPEPEPEPEPDFESESEFEPEPERPPIVTPPPKPTTTATPIPSRLAALAAPTGTVSSTSVPALTPQMVTQSQANPAPPPPPMPQASVSPLHNVEPKLMISESTRFIAKLNQRIVEAESKLSSKSDQAKERLNKLLTEFVDEAEKLEKQREQNSMNLTAKATKNLERVAEQLKSLIQDTSAQAIIEIDDISTNSASEITQLNQEILATLKSADQRVKIDSDTAVELTHQKLEGHVEKRLDEYQAQNALQQLEATNEEFASRLDERFSRFEVRIKQEIQSILSSLERNVGSMNEEIEGSWDRASEKLLIGRADFERTVNHLVRDCELIIEQRTKLAYIEKILPKLLDNKDIFRTMLTDMKKNFEEQADQTISSHIEGLERNISSAKDTLERVVEQCVVELDEIGNSQQKDIENLFDTYNDRLNEMHTMTKIKIGEARKKIEENEEVCTRVREYARTEEDPVLSKERAKTRTMLSDVRNQSEQTLEATIQTYCQTMEDLSETLQSDLTVKRNDWTHQVKQSSEDGLAQIKQAIADAYQAIEIAKEKYME